MVYARTSGTPRATEPARVPELVGAEGSASIDAQHGGRVSVGVPVPDEDMQRYELYIITRGSGKGLGFTSLTLNGKPAETRHSEHTGWSLHSIDLAALRGTSARIEATLPGGGEEPFSSPDVTVSAWFIADRPVEAAAVTHEGHIPLPISAGFRRQTVEVLPATALSRRSERRLTVDNLKGATAAKLRVRVFDVNREPQYADKQILLNGQRIDQLRPSEISRRGLARSFQVSNLFTRLSVFENLRCAVL